LYPLGGNFVDANGLALATAGDTYNLSWFPTPDTHGLVLVDKNTSPNGMYGAGPVTGLILRGRITPIDAALATTPLPAALPLFAGGLGVLGLLTKRRERKAAAAA
jgi:hypothetical protein